MKVNAVERIQIAFDLLKDLLEAEKSGEPLMNAAADAFFTKERHFMEFTIAKLKDENKILAKRIASLERKIKREHGHGA